MIKDAKLTAIYGRRGSGKTTQVREQLKGRNRVVIFDPRNEYGDCEAVTHGPHCSYDDLLKSVRDRWDDKFSIPYLPPAGREPEALHGLCRLLWQVQRTYELGDDDRKITLVIEEMDLSYPVRQLPAELDGMARVMNQGRHVGIEVIGVTQRPAQISTTFRGNVEDTYIFPLALADDRAAVLQLIGREHADTLNGLSNHSYIYIVNGEVTIGKNSPLT